MGATPADMLRQIDSNYGRMDEISTLLNKPIPTSKLVQLQKEINNLWQAQKYWVSEYQKATGRKLPLAGLAFGEVTYLSKASEDSQKAKMVSDLAAKKAHDENVNRLAAAIRETHAEYRRLRSLLQDQYDISTTMQNALFSDWVRMGAGVSARHPLYWKKAVEDRAWPKLLDAEKFFNEKEYDKSWQKVVSAAKDVKWGFDCLEWWFAKLETGAKRAEAAIKISAALAAVIVAAPSAVVVGPTMVNGVAVTGVPLMVETGTGTAMALAAVGEASQQGTILILNKASGGHEVTLADLKTATLEVVVSTGTAGFGKVVSKGVSKFAITKVLGRAPTEQELKFAEDRIEAYVVANSSSLSKKFLKLDTNPDWNWWYNQIMPALGTTAPELVKEKDLTFAAGKK